MDESRSSILQRNGRPNKGKGRVEQDRLTDGQTDRLLKPRGISADLSDVDDDSGGGHDEGRAETPRPWPPTSSPEAAASTALRPILSPSCSLSRSRRSERCIATGNNSNSRLGRRTNGGTDRRAKRDGIPVILRQRQILRRGVRQLHQSGPGALS